MWTHRLYCTAALRQIDYMFVLTAQATKVVRAGICTELEGKPDHWAIFIGLSASIGMPAQSQKVR
eukprot:3107047-Pyramimonas_sp.AAC.1